MAAISSPNGFSRKVTAAAILRKIGVIRKAAIDTASKAFSRTNRNDARPLLFVFICSR